MKVPSKFCWATQATQDLKAIDACLRQDAPQAAAQTIAKLIRQLEIVLRVFPQAGRFGHYIGLREYRLDTNYRALYRLKDGSVEILRILHVARKFPKR